MPEDYLAQLDQINEVPTQRINMDESGVRDQIKSPGPGINIDSDLEIGDESQNRPNLESRQSPGAQEFNNPELVGKITTLMDRKVPVLQMRTALMTQYNEAETNAALRQAIQPRVDELLAKGITQDKIDSILVGQGIISSASPSIESSLNEGGPSTSLTPSLEDSLPIIKLNQSTEDTVAQLKQLTNSYEKDYNQFVGWAGMSDKAKLKGQKLQQETDNLILSELQKRGIKGRIGKGGTLFATDPETGVESELDDSMLDDLWGSKFEMGAAMGGAATAARLGAPLLATGPVGWTAYGLTVLVGGAIGAAGGAAADVTTSAMQLKYELSTQELLAKMKDAGVAELALGALGTTAFQLVKGAGKSSKYVWNKTLGKALNKVWGAMAQNNQKEAANIMVEAAGMEMSEAIEFVTKFEKLTGNQVLSDQAKLTGKLTAEESTDVLRTLAITQTDQTALVRKAIKGSNKFGAEILKNITNTADDLNKSAAKLTTGNMKIVIQEDLKDYVTKVKNYNTNIRQIGADVMDTAGYQFDYDSVIITDQLRDVSYRLSNDTLQSDVADIMDSIGRIGGKTVDGKERTMRSFGDLLDIRTSLGTILDDKRLDTKMNRDRIKYVKDNIDAEIAKAVPLYLDSSQSKEWLAQWTTSQNEYGKMLEVQSNTLYKALMKPDISEASVINALATDNIEALTTYRSVLGRLPQKTRELTEGAIVNKMIKDATVGQLEDGAAINFIKLENNLKRLALTTKDAKAMKQVSLGLAEIWRDHPGMRRAVGSVTQPENLAVGGRYGSSAYLAFTAAREVIMSRIPFTTDSKRRAVLKNLAKAIDNPLDAKSVKALLRDLPPDPELKAEFGRLAVSYARFGQPEKYDGVEIYEKISKSSPKGTLEITAEGGKGSTPVKTINPARLATITKASRELGREVTEENMLDPLTLSQLKDKGWLGVSTAKGSYIFQKGNSTAGGVPPKKPEPPSRPQSSPLVKPDPLVPNAMDREVAKKNAAANSVKKASIKSEHQKGFESSKIMRIAQAKRASAQAVIKKAEEAAFPDSPKTSSILTKARKDLKDSSAAIVKAIDLKPSSDVSNSSVDISIPKKPIAKPKKVAIKNDKLMGKLREGKGTIAELKAGISMRSMQLKSGKFSSLTPAARKSLDEAIASMRSKTLKAKTREIFDLIESTIGNSN